MKVRCLKCKDVIEGDKKGTLIFCKCESVAIDETENYVRILGYIENYEEVKEKENENTK